ncbi:MAG: hypothetical protein WCP34_12500 [Pseudomonadota bacterium]
MADFKAGLTAYRQKNYSQALAEWQPAAKSGNTKAMLMLGQMYERGEGVTTDLVQAEKWYKAATERMSKPRHYTNKIKHERYMIHNDKGKSRKE